jgi:vacuolar-type H+-ATPase subunit D/Vma8
MEHIQFTGSKSWYTIIANKINELVEAVNELEQVKARVEKLEQDIEVLKRG